MPYIILSIGLVLALYTLSRFFMKANTKEIKAFGLAALTLTLAAALFYLAVTGRLAAALGLLVALTPLVLGIFRPRNPAPGGREAPERPGERKPMTRREALEVLGLNENASAADIKAAHRKLIAKVHPDHEGSAWLAAQLNAARDMLLKET